MEAILRRLDRLTLEEARTTGTATLEVVYDLLKQMRMAMDGMHDLVLIPCAALSICIFPPDKHVLMDDIRRTLGMFVALTALSLLTVAAVDMQQVASNMNKFRRVFNPDLQLSSVMANVTY